MKKEPLLYRLSPRCGRLVKLISANLDHFSLWRFIQIKMHTSYCEACTNYDQQLKLLKKTADKHHFSPAYTLGAEQKEALVKYLQENKDKPLTNSAPPANTLMRLLTSGAALAGGLAVFALFIFKATPERFDVVVHKQQGNVTIDQENQRFETTDGTLQLIVDQKNILELRPNSRLLLNRARKHLWLEAGHLSAVLMGDFSKQGIKLKTRHHTTTLHGTVVHMAHENENQIYSCLCHSAYTIGTVDQKQRYEAGHHSAVRIVKKGQKYKIVRAPMLYHDDKSLNQMASVVKEKIDWN